MASLIIDGYNVIGLLHKNLHEERQRFIEKIIGYSKAKGHEIWVVFDGWKDGRATETRQLTGGITVIYSPIGEKADSIIKKMIAGSRRQWIVVSSDRDIQSFVWSRDCVPVDSEDFLTASGLQEADDEALFDSPRGGGSKQGKKEKAVKRALEKL